MPVSRGNRCNVAAAVLVLWTAPALAHFQTMLPSTDDAQPTDDRTIHLDIRFTHPMEGGPAMSMGEPAQFGVLVNGQKQDLRESLQPIGIDGSRAYTAEFTVQRPGAHVFYIEPAPYWESSEGTLIIHYTKVVVGAMGSWAGWDAMVGFPVEIEPLVRPMGLWTGNVFRGIVRQNGEPVPFATVEVEYYNEDQRVEPPSDAFVTQVVKTEEDGVFTYGIPRAGWWGFAALVEADDPVAGPDGQPAEVELGAVMWVQAMDMEESDAAPHAVEER